MSERESQLQMLALAQKQLLASKLQEAFSPEDPNSRPTFDQDVAFKALATHDFLDVSGGNQAGKSQWGARNIVWFCQRNHPYLDINALWPNQRILCLLLGQSTKIIDEHWETRIRPFFDENDYKEKVQGGILQSVTFKKFNTKLICFSYENAASARDRVQGFTGHIVWIDELCKLLDLYEEAERRMQANGGKTIVTYTQKVRAPQVRKYLKAPSPYKSHHILNAFSNPRYDEEKRAKIEASIAQFPPDIREIKRKQILEGDYADDEKFPYPYDKESWGCDWPENYSREWRHLVAVDPAASGKVGYTLFAEDPDKDLLDKQGKTQALWYLVNSKYIEGDAPSTLVELVEKECEDYNVVERIADPHETWFIKEARKAKVIYKGLIKDNRKTELIKNPVEAFEGGWLKVIDDGKSNEMAINEMGEAIWKEDGATIKNSTKYHILDSFQYGYDKRPSRDEDHKPMTPHKVLYLANKQRKQKEAARASQQKLRVARKRRRR